MWADGRLGRVGIWSAPLRRADPEAAVAAARELERLGFAAVWLPGGEEGLGNHLDALLAATERLVFCVGIVNIWAYAAPDVAAMYASLEARYPGRLLLGFGIGHRPLVDAGSPGRFRRPFAALARYLDQLDRAQPPLAAGSRVLAAFGPQMLAVARDRAAGAHPYLVTPEHTRHARQVLGPDRLLAPEQHVVLETDPAIARGVAREYLTTYWDLPHYTASFRRMGYGDRDFEGGGSDRLVDGLVAWGGVERIAARVREHLEAGADHVCVQVLTAGKRGLPVESWSALAAAGIV